MTRFISPRRRWCFAADSAWAGTIFIVLVAAGLVAWIYKATPVAIAPWRRYTLAGLRIVFLALLLALLLRPVLAFTVEGSIRRVLALLVLDGSASMQIADPRLDANDQEARGDCEGNSQSEGGTETVLDRSRSREFEQVLSLGTDEGGASERTDRFAAATGPEVESVRVQLRAGTGGAVARKLETNASGSGRSKKASVEALFEQLGAAYRGDAVSTAIGDGIRGDESQARPAGNSPASCW